MNKSLNNLLNVHVLRSYGFGGGEKQLGALLTTPEHNKTSILFLLFRDKKYENFLQENGILFSNVFPFEIKSSNNLFIEFGRLLILLPILSILLSVKINRLKPKNLVAHGAQALFTIQILKFFSNYRIFYVHRGLKKNRKWDKLTELLYLKTYRVIAVSKAVAKSLECYISPNKIITIPNGVVPQKQITVGLNNKITLVTTGRLIPLKDHAFLIKSVSKLKFPFVLKILGDGPELENLRSLSKDLGIEDKIEFCGFVVDPIRELKKADIFIFASTSEGMSNAILEAMSLGLPIIAVDCPGVTECLENNAGILTKRNVQDFASCLTHLNEDRNYLKHIGDNCYRRMNEKYTIQKNAESFYSLLSKL